MSDAPVTEETTVKDNLPQENGVILISYPKIVFMWPSWVAAIFCAIYMWANNDLESAGAVNVCRVFLTILTINFVVLSFDFPRTTSFILFSLIAVFVLAIALIVNNNPNFLPVVGKWLAGIQPAANSTFYWLYSAIMGVIYIFVFITSRFDYWEVRPNELLHHHGVLSDLERFSAPHLRIEKEINDVFEYLLLGAGRLILHPRGERRAIVLDNVFFISAKEKRITKLLSALQVQVREGD